MDQSSTTQDLHHVIHHPLSRLILHQYEDKDGCSKNGSRELLIDCGFIKKYQIDRSLEEIILDSRGIPLNTVLNKSQNMSYENEEKILNFKQLFYPEMKSSIPIVVDSEVEPISHLFKNFVNKYSAKRVDKWLQNPNDRTSELISAFGHVIGIYSSFPSITIKESNSIEILNCLQQLPHFRSLGLRIDHSCQESFYENFGVCLGSKLVHLVINSFQNDSQFHPLENCLSQFTKLKLLNLYMGNSRFNPSLRSLFS